MKKYIILRNRDITNEMLLALNINYSDTSSIYNSAGNITEYSVLSFKMVKPECLSAYKTLTRDECVVEINKIAGNSNPDNLSVHNKPAIYSNAFAAKTLPDGKKLFKRIHGTDYADIAPLETVSFQIEIGYPLALMEAVEIFGAGKEHNADLLILAPDFTVVNQFGFDANVAEGYYRSFSRYDAALPMGFIIEALITNNSGVTSRCALNVELNEAK